MLGHKISDFRLLTIVSLEDLVPEDNFYRQVERSIDLSFVRDLANEFYSNIGRPSIDPVVFFKLQMIAKHNGERLHGIRKPHYQRITDERVSPTDPDSAPMQLSGGGSAVLGYHDHYVGRGQSTHYFECYADAGCGHGQHAYPGSGGLGTCCYSKTDRAGFCLSAQSRCV